MSLALHLTKKQLALFLCLLALLLTLLIVAMHTASVPIGLHHLADNPNVPFNRP